jgi:hypothetical protein
VAWADSHKSAPGRSGRSDADGHVHERLRGIIDLDPDAVGKRLNGVHSACQRLRGPHGEVDLCQVMVRYVHREVVLWAQAGDALAWDI